MANHSKGTGKRDGQAGAADQKDMVVEVLAEAAQPHHDALAPELFGTAEQVLRAIRRIVQSITIHSKKLYRQTGLTMPQLLCLRAMGAAKGEEVTAAEVARAIHLSPATVTGILDRMERDGLIERHRRSKDRRKISLDLTDMGRRRLADNALSLQDRFLGRLMALEPAQRANILQTLEKVVEMIEASSIDASPILIPGEIEADGHLTVEE